MALTISGPTAVAAREAVLLVASEPDVDWIQTAGPTVTLKANTAGQVAYLAPSTIDGATITCQATTRAPALTLPSPGFEDGDPYGDWYYGNLTKTVGPAYARTGTNGVRLTIASGQSWGDMMAPASGWAAGETYEVRGWVNIRTRAGTSWGLVVTCLHPGGNQITAGTKTTTTGSWVEVTHTFTVPTGATGVHLGITVGGTSTGTAEVWVDDITATATGGTPESKTHSATVARHSPQVKTSTAWQMRKGRKDPPVWLPRSTGRDIPVTLFGVNWGVHVEGTAPTAMVEEATNPSQGLPQHRFTVGGASSPSGVERCEMECWPKIIGFGQEWWWSFAVRWDGTIAPAGWCNIAQVHHTADPGELDAAQPFAFEIEPGTSNGWRVITRSVAASITTTSPLGYTRANGTFAAGGWSRFVLRLRFTRGTSNAGLSVWQDGVQKFTSDTIPMGHNDTDPLYPKFGIYRQAQTGTAQVEFANMELSTTSLLGRVASPLPVLTR